MNSNSKKLVLLLGDIVIIYLSLFLTVYLRYSNIDPAHTNFTTSQLFFLHVKVFTPLIFAWLVIFYIHNLYEITSAKNTLEFYSSLARSLVINFFAAVLFFYFASLTEIAPKTNLFIYFAIFSFLFLLWRGQVNSVLKSKFLVSTVVMSDDDRDFRLALKLNQNPQVGYKVIFFAGSKPANEGPNKFWPEFLSPSKKINISDLVQNNKVKAFIIDDKFFNKDVLVTSLSDFVGRIEITNLTKFNERVWRKVDINGVNNLWFLNNFSSGRRLGYEFVKRVVDFIASLVFFPLAIVLGVAIAIIIKLEGRGPIFYKQVRIGHRGKLFTLIKFRTMRTDAEATGAQWTVQDDNRITKGGRFLRKTRLDELPQLINIIKGEMSFVGPRAERPEFHELLIKEILFYEKRYLVKPGLTGWAQINYTYGSSVEDTKEKLSYDFYYLKNRSLVFDIGIILKTVNIVLSGLGR